MEQDEIEARIALYNAVIAAAQAALEILNSEDSDEDELNIDVFLFGAKAIVKQLVTVYDMQSILDDIADGGEDD